MPLSLPLPVARGLKLLIRRSWALPVAAILLWANWEAPAMHHYVRPIEMTVWQLAPVGGPTAAQALASRLATEPGIAACSVSPRTNCVAFVYHPGRANLAALYEAVGRHGGHVIDNPPASNTPPLLRQCPVPDSYLAFLDQVRFALNLRRLFVSV